jgi:hypothetical protein
LKKGRRPVREHLEPKWPGDKKIYAEFAAALIVLLLASISSYWTTISDGAIELNRIGGTEFKITFGEIKYKERA